MENKILNGQKIATIIEERLKNEIKSIVEETAIVPGLATMLIGENPASKIYVNIKEKACERVGIKSETIHFPETVTEEKLLVAIDNLNEDPSIHGILIQLPLPPQINIYKIFYAINPKKDVDCFHPLNFGKLLLGDDYFAPCTARGIIYLLEYYGIPLSGQETVIVNHSNLLGKPLALMLLNRDATVSIAHIKTKDLKRLTLTADILVVGTGVPRLIKEDMVKENVIIVDVGINRVEDKIVGDVDFENVIDKVRAITPVPGGVGPMTVASLLQNTLYGYKNFVPLKILF